MANLPQGIQELSVVRDKVGRPPGELGVSMSMEYDIFPSINQPINKFITCHSTEARALKLVGWATGRASGLKTLGAGLVVVTF